MNIQDAALFAMDAYNRSTAPLGFPTPFGAKVIDQTTEGAFAAVAYYLPDADEIIFAYRGTDEPWSDGFTGWPLGSGWYDSPQSQADLAFGFFNDVMADISEPTHEFHYASSADVVFTGHSLGGGLAGLVASINELPAFVFDSMPFTQAANKLYGDVTGPYNYLYWKALAYPDGIVHEPSFDLIQSAALENEALAPLRWGTPFGPLGGAVLTSDIESQRIGQDEIKAGAITDIYDLHSQALLTIALYGGLQHSAQREAGGEAIYHHLFDGALASRLGYANSEALRQMLAYTIDDADTAALDGLFADMDQLGAMRLAEISQFMPANRYFGALGKVAVVHAVHVANDSGAGLSVGLIQHVNGTANIDLSGTLDAIGTINDFIEFAAVGPAGVFFDLNVSQVENLAVAWSGYGGTAYLQAGGTIFFGSEYVDDIYGSDENDIILSMGSDGAFFDNIWAGGGDDVIYASAGADMIHDGSGDDRAHGGTGNDTFHGGTGSDTMFGEADNDTFHLGEAEEGDVDYVNGGAHTGTGDVVEVSVGATYRLDAAGAAAIRNQIVANGFAAPTGHGIGIEMAVGDAFVQGVEIIRASAEANELVIGTASDLAAVGAKTFDFTAGADDSVLYSGEMPATLTLSGDNGRSKAVQAGATATSFLGVDEWNLTASGNSVTVDKSHLGQQPVTINAGPGIDLLNLSSFTTEIVFGLTPVVGGTNITVTGFERVYGGSGNDTFHGTNADEMFLGNGGTNTFYGSLGADYLSSSGGNLIVDYSLSAEAVIFMRSSSTSTSAVAHASMSVGSMGYGDTLVASGWSDITGSEGADTLLVVGTHGTLRSNGGTDTLIGNKNSDTLVGADGYAEIMRPGDGNDTIQFGTGGGTLDFSTSTRAAVIDLLDGTFVFGDQFDTVTGDFDKVIGTASGDDIRGTEGADTIDGGSGTGYDVIYGRGGADTITFRNGVVRGGTGNDVISSTQSSTIVFGEDDDDTISVGKDSLVYGGGGNDNITAGEGSTIYGDDGADTINVSAKFVTVHGGSGGDVINISAISWYAMSTLSYSQSDAGVSVVRSGTGFLASGGHAEGDQLSGKFNVVGSDFADVFDLDVSDIGFIKAGGGDDVITLRLTDGEAYGESGDDTITLTSRHQDAFGGDGNDTFHGYGRMFGGEGDDEFYLGYGNYAAGPFSHVKVGGTVRGGSGQNYIEGGAGNDTIWMDEGSDTFIYSSGGGHDQIYMAGPDDHLILDGVAGFSSISDIASNLFEDAGRTELRFDGFDQKIGFMNMTASQVLALDWAFN